jgi:hypothetical protein
MNIDNLYKIFARSLFFFALAILTVGLIEAAATSLGYSILGEAYAGGRLVELSAALVVFVIAVLLRQIRDALTNPGGN